MAQLIQTGSSAVGVLAVVAEHTAVLRLICFAAPQIAFICPWECSIVVYCLLESDMSATCIMLAGPAHPFQKDGLAAGLKNHRAGHVEDTHLHSFAFDEQYNTYHSYGYAAAPGGQQLVGAVEAAAGGSVYGNAAKRRKTAEEKAAAQERKRKLQEEAQAQLASGQPFTLTNRIPWAEKEVKV